MQSNPSHNAQLSAFQDMMERGILHDAFEGSPGEVIIFDGRTLQIVTANKQARDSNGCLRQLRQMTILDLVDGMDPNRLIRFSQMVQLRPNSTTYFQITSHLSEDRMLDVRLRCIPGPPRTVIAFVIDITRQLRARQSAARTAARFASAIEALSDSFVLYDENDQLFICNEAYRSIYNCSAPAMKIGARFEETLRYGLAEKQYADAHDREEEWLRERLAAKR